MFYLMLKLGPK